MKTLKNILSLTLVFLASLSMGILAVDTKQNTVSVDVKEKPATSEQKAAKKPEKRVVRTMWQQFDDMMHDVHCLFDRHACRDGRKELAVYDSEAVDLPQISIGGNMDDNDIRLTIKGLSLKKEDIKAEYDEEEGSAHFTFPYKESVVTLRIYPRSLLMEAEKKITQEKKDAKGNVLGSFNYMGYNSYKQSWRNRVNVTALDAGYKDGTLTIKIGASPIRRVLSIK